jgi:alpha-L-arabinofuranosidase
MKVRCIVDDRPEKVLVDLRAIRTPVNPRCLGINLDYLMDDETRRVNPVRPLSAALKEMGVRVLRFPGGDKSDSMLWSHPPYDRADPVIAVSGDWDWPAMDRTLFMEDRRTWRVKPMDFDAYTALSGEIGAESSLVVCLDPAFRTRDAHHEAVAMERLVLNAVEWVRYARRRGFRVRCWEIGNESYFVAGATTYADAVARFASAMKEADPDARIGATALYGESVGGKDQASGIPWNRAVLEGAGKWLDYLIVHDYPNYGWKGYSGYLDRDPDFTAGVRKTRKTIAKWAPVEARNRIKVALTEYGTIDYAKDETWANVSDLGHSLLLANMIGQYLSEPDLDYATMWNTRWVGNEKEPRDVHDALAPDNRLTPTGTALALWAEFLGSRMADLSTGRLLKVYAMHTPETGALAVFILNKGMSAHEVTLEVANGARTSGERWLYSGTGPGDLAPVLARAGKVELKGGMASLLLPPVSLTVVGF